MGAFKPTAEIEELAGRLAAAEGRDINEAVADALREALLRRAARTDPLLTASELREKYGITLSSQARKPVSQSVYDELGPRP